MRILWHSPAPWTPTGYGVQTALFLPRIRDLGHDLTVSAVNQHLGSPLIWDGFPCLPAGAIPYGADVIQGHYRESEADMVITLTDTWHLDIDAFIMLNAVCWTPVDCNPLGFHDTEFIRRSNCRPLVMSRHGEQMMNQVGFFPLYVPHGVDTSLFKPPASRGEARKAFGLDDDTFVAGINAMNKGLPPRKAFAQQFAGFANFHKRHPNSVLFVNSQVAPPDGENLAILARELGILECTRFTDHYAYITGQFTQEELARWYAALDVLLSATMAEGFCLPVIEAMACGTPVIGSRCSSLPELIPPSCGWLVDGVKFWNPTHRAWWLDPDLHQITKALEKALKGAAGKRDAARSQAMNYDADYITREYWKPTLEILGG